MQQDIFLKKTHFLLIRPRLFLIQTTILTNEFWRYQIQSIPPLNTVEEYFLR